MIWVPKSSKFYINNAIYLFTLLVIWKRECVVLSDIELYVFLRYFIHSIFQQWLYSAFLGPGLFFSFLICTQPVGLLGQGSAIHQAAAYTQNNTKNKRTQTFMPRMGFEHMITASERWEFMSKTARSLWSALRYLLHFTFNILPVFIRRWEIQACLHRTCFAVDYIHNVWRVLVCRVGGLWLY
jgi:hypothetical protein